MARHPWVAAADNGKPRWGVQLIAPNERGALPALMETAKLVESLDFDAAFVFDHPALHADPWVALSGMATLTNRIRLGSAVNCNGYRHPAMLARLGADLDNLSEGRLLFGIGSGWLEWEFAAFDLAFRSVPKRQAALNEALQIIQGVWGDHPFTFNGDYHRVNNLQIQPSPLQTPRPPIIIGGSGERVTLRQVAQYADACNISEELAPNDPDVSDMDRAAAVERKFNALRQHCRDLGRPEDEVLRTHFTANIILGPTQSAADAKADATDPSVSTSPGRRRGGRNGILVASPERAIAYYRMLRSAGAEYFVIQLDAPDHETIKVLAEQVIPEVA
jgi:alkanesulfonate monooxygenase SsuD/methylene tetrahydromethanopterin reductase-like flavin-dependent oxidoreductase (luciferase family)